SQLRRLWIVTRSPSTSAHGVCATSACQFRLLDGRSDSHHANTVPPAPAVNRTVRQPASNQKTALVTSSRYAIAAAVRPRERRSRKRAADAQRLSRPTVPSASHLAAS